MHPSMHPSRASTLLVTFFNGNVTEFCAYVRDNYLSCPERLAVRRRSDILREVGAADTFPPSMNLIFSSCDAFCIQPKPRRCFRSSEYYAQAPHRCCTAHHSSEKTSHASRGTTGSRPAQGGGSAAKSAQSTDSCFAAPQCHRQHFGIRRREPFSPSRPWRTHI